jgi:hypothetical protein
MRPGRKCLVFSDFLSIRMKKYLYMKVPEKDSIPYVQCYGPQIGF